jgi:pimeloyl-ACP methyl ester carboxylesterase
MTPLIHLHGATGAASLFQPLIHELHDAANFSFDFEGHGESRPTQREFRIEYFAENLQHFIEHHKLAPARIVGYSMGGYVALWLASKNESLIHSILTLGTNLSWSAEHAKKQVRFLNADLMLKKVPDYARELEKRHANAGWRTVLSKTENMMLDLGENPRLGPDDYAQIKCRVRYGVGDRDAMVSIDETRDAYKATPGAELYVLPGTEHPLDRVHLHRWAAVIRDFFGL